MYTGSKWGFFKRMAALRKAARFTIWAGVVLALVGCSSVIPATGRAAPTAPGSSGPTPSVTATLTLAACPDAQALVKAFYDANDAGKYDQGLAFFAEGATLHTYASGLYGDRMEDITRTSPAQIRAALSTLGLKRYSGIPGDAVYHEDEFQVYGPNKLAFYLRPDRLDPQKRPYNPYNVTIEFEGCKFKSMTVIEIISWV